MSYLHRRVYRPAAVAALIVAGLVLSACGGSGSAAPSSGGKKKIYVAMSYSGNAWQSEASNLALSVAKMPPFGNKVSVTREIAGTAVQGQISQYQSMIADGAKVIVSFPVSPTALNSTIAEGCAKGVYFVMYDATVTAPCAYNVSYITAPPSQADQHSGGAPNTPFMGYDSMTWLANKLHGHGNIFDITGVAGNSVSATHEAGVLGALKKFPGIHVIDRYVGNWDDATEQSGTAQALAAHPDVNGIWAGYGEQGAIAALKAAGKTIPVSGETEDGWRVDIKNGYPGISAGSPPAQGGIAMKVALALVFHGPAGIPKNIEPPMPWVSSQNVKLCDANTDTNNCNTLPLGKVSPQSSGAIFLPQLFPESSLSASLSGNPPAGATMQPVSTFIKELDQYQQPPSRRYATRSACDAGWKPGMLPEGIQGCVKG